MQKDSAAGRVLGILVFLVGIGILVTVAVVTSRLFTESSSVLQVKPGSPAGTTSELGSSAIRLLYQIALLVVLCVAGSLVAARGLHLYFVASGLPPPRRVASKAEDEGTGNRE